MADSLHWLTSKQGDSWTSSSIGPLLTPERLNLLLDDYSSLDTSTKTCLLLAIANLSPRAIKTNAKQLYQIICRCGKDEEHWVRVMAEVVKPLLETQSLEASVSGSIHSDLMETLKSAFTKHGNSFAHKPQHWAYLNTSSLEHTPLYCQSTSRQPFVLQKLPSSHNLRKEIFHRASSGGSHGSQKGSVVHEKAPTQRSHEPTPAALLSSRKSIPIPGLHARVQRESRTKLLDISDMPPTARKKRRESEAGVARISRQDSVSSVPPATPSPVEKTAPPTIARPDYAAGLGPLSSDTGSTLYGDHNISSSHPPPTTPILPATPISQFPAYPRSSSSAAAVPQPSPTTLTPTQPAAAPVKLQLNKQQLAVAHKMFEEAPTLTREQKALILGFMAGSRDNPYPEKGHVLTIILNEKTLQEAVVTPSGQQGLRTVIVQTAFEMNYKNGLWRKLQIKRPVNT